MTDTLSSASEYKTITLTVPDTSSSEILLNFILWDAQGLTTVVTEKITVTNNPAIATFLNMIASSTPQDQTILQSAAQDTLTTISDPSTLTTISTEMKLSVSSSIAETFSSDVSYEQPSRSTVTLSTTSTNTPNLAISEIANVSVIRTCSISCQNGGICKVDSGLQYCDCPSGYSGYSCQYPGSVSTQLQTVYSSALTSVVGDPNSSTTDFTRALDSVLQTPDLIGGDVSRVLIQAVDKFVDSSSQPQDLIPIAQALKWSVRTHSESYLRSSSSMTDLTFTVIDELKTSQNSLKQVVQQIALSTASQNEASVDIQILSGTNLRYGAVNLNKDNAKNFSLTDSNSNFSVTVPSSVFNSGSSSSSLVMVYTSNDDNPYPYSNSTITNGIFSPTVSISFIDSATKATVPISGLDPPLTLSFPIADGSPLQAAVRSFENLQKTNKKVNLTELFANVTTCMYWDTATSSWSSNGLTLVSINQTHYTCGSTHTTDFVSVFFETGLSVLQNSEFDLIAQADNWNLLFTTPIAENLGFWILLVVFISYVVLQSYGIYVDEVKFRYMPRAQVLDDIKDKKTLLKKRQMEAKLREEKKRKKEEAKARPSAVEILKTEGLSSSKHLKTKEVRIIPKNICENSLDKSGSLTMELNSSMDGLVKLHHQASGSNELGSSQDLSIAENSPDVGVKIKSKNGQPVKRKGFFQYWGEDLKDNHAMLNCLIKTNRLSPRHARFTLLYFTFLAEFTFCIIFYKPPQYELDSWSHFWSGLSEMFWGSLFSAICSCPVIFLLSFLFKVPSSLVESLRKVSPEEFHIELRRVARAMKWRYIFAYIIFALAFIVCSMYILLFCAQVGAKESRSFLNSSAMSITIDQVGLEMLPGLLGAIFYVLSSRYQCCRVFGKMELLITIIRCYKSLSGY